MVQRLSACGRDRSCLKALIGNRAHLLKMALKCSKILLILEQLSLQHKYLNNVSNWFKVLLKMNDMFCIWNSHVLMEEIFVQKYLARYVKLVKVNDILLKLMR